MNDIDTFCHYLKLNKVKDSKKLFSDMNVNIQKSFFKNSWTIMRNSVRYKPKTVILVYYIFKLFKTGENKLYDTYHAKKEFKNKFEAIKNKAKKFMSQGYNAKYDKKFQKYPTPDETDPMRLFYQSHYEDVKKRASEAKGDILWAGKWLLEHGVYDGKERDELEKLYAKYSN